MIYASRKHQFTETVNETDDCWPTIPSVQRGFETSCRKIWDFRHSPNVQNRNEAGRRQGMEVAAVGFDHALPN
jgi:hypothetical protein